MENGRGIEERKKRNTGTSLSVACVFVSSI